MCFAVIIDSKIATSVEEQTKSKFLQYAVIIESTQIKDDGSLLYSSLSGTMLNDYWILTCAHESKIKYGGFVKINDQSYSIEKIIPHPSYEKGDINQDFALIRIKNPLRHQVVYPLIKSRLDASTFYPGPHLFVAFTAGEIEWNERNSTRTYFPIVGEIAKFFSNFGIEEVDRDLIRFFGQKPLFSVTSYAAEIKNSTNFRAQNGDSGGGLFSLDGHLLGVYSHTVTVKIDTLSDPAYINCFALIDSKVYQWIKAIIGS